MGNHTGNPAAPWAARYSLFNLHALATVFGASRNWNYAGASAAEMEVKNPGIVEAFTEARRVAGAKLVYAPKPAFNARVVHPEDLPLELLPGFFRGADADGVILRPGQSYALASADCPTVIIFDPVSQQLAALHLGRDAAIDRGRIEGKEPREFESVIDAAIAEMELGGMTDRSDLRGFVVAGIGYEYFTHPITDLVDGEINPYAERNRALIADLQERYDHAGDGPFPTVVRDVALGQIDLTALIARQLAAHGIIVDLGRDSDGVDTHTDTYPDGRHVYHSNRRDKVARNLVLVTYEDAA